MLEYARTSQAADGTRTGTSVVPPEPTTGTRQVLVPRDRYLSHETGTKARDGYLSLVVCLRTSLLSRIGWTFQLALQQHISMVKTAIAFTVEEK